MKKQIRNLNLILPALVLCGWLGATARGNAQAILTVDSSANWAGYINVFQLPADGGTTDPLAATPLTGYQHPTSLLQANFGTNTLTLNPCTAVWETADTIYVKGDGVTPNEYIDANMYVDTATLLNTNVIFVGTCLSNNLTTSPEPYVTAYNNTQGYLPTNAYYQCFAFIKVFNSDYSSLLGYATSNLVAGQAFSVALNTASFAGAAHVQYGFETFGPDQATNYPFASNSVVIAAQTGNTKVVTVDPSQAWAGYINVFDLPASAGGDGAYVFGSTWGTADLQAHFVGTNALVLNPCTNVWYTNNTATPPADNSYFYVTPGGTPNKIMDASMYVQNNALLNTNVTFVGLCLSNNLTANPEPLTGVAYTSVAFIKTFDANYNLLNSAVSGPLTAGQAFNISLNTSGAANVQYGFETIGPDVAPDSATALNSVVLQATTPPAAPLALTNAAPTPTLPQSAVLSMYNSSGVYTNAPGINWHAAWSQSGYSQFTIPGTTNSVLKYSNMAFDGVEFYTPVAINTTGYDHFHVDVWTPDGNSLGIQLVSINPTAAAEVDFPPSTGAITNDGKWQSLDIPLSAFAAKNPSTVLTNLQQLLWVNNQTAANGNGFSGSDTNFITLATFYIDNVYFYTSTALTSPTLNAGLSAGSFQLSFPTLNGHNYTVQYKTNLTDAVWQTLGSAVSGDGTVQSVTDAPGQSHRFYRLMVQ